jgi:hypothetical protein
MVCVVVIIPARGKDTVSGVLSSQAASRGDAPFLVYEREPGIVEKTTWAEQDARARRTAAALSALGISAGARFGVHLSNCPDFYDIWFGAAYLGAVIVPTNPLSTAAELGYLLGHSGCRVVLTQPTWSPPCEKPELRRSSTSPARGPTMSNPTWVRRPPAPATCSACSTRRGPRAGPKACRSPTRRIWQSVTRSPIRSACAPTIDFLSSSRCSMEMRNTIARCRRSSRARPSL